MNVGSEVLKLTLRPVTHAGVPDAANSPCCHHLSISLSCPLTRMTEEEGRRQRTGPDSRPTGRVSR